MQLFYTEHLLSNEVSVFDFSREESKHIAKVLRKKPDDKLTVTDGQGSVVQVVLTMVTPSLCTARVLTYRHEASRAYDLHIYIAPTKMNDRLEWFLEKACEIGITSITPLICHNSERKVIKPERWHKILKSSTKQSLQCYIPKLHPVLTFKQYIAQQEQLKEVDQSYIAHCYTPQEIQPCIEKHTLSKKITPNQSYRILIGPEGDFSKDEVSTALDTGHIPITLGNTRLRTETAGICAVHTVSLLHLS